MFLCNIYNLNNIWQDFYFVVIQKSLEDKVFAKTTAKHTHNIKLYSLKQTT
jgi:cell division protein YceG involved in septum cleavage